MTLPTGQQPTDTTEQQVTDPFEQARAEARQAALAEAAGVYGSAIQDAERRAREAQEQLNAARVSTQTPPKTVESAEYFADPVSHTRNLIREELAQAVAPLNELARQTQNQNTYMQVKQQLRMHPQLGPHFAAIESVLDQEARYLNQIDVNSVGALAVNIIGRANLGMIPGVALGAPARPVAPPQVPPAAPRNVPTAPTTPVELTEDQRRLARMNGMTDEQYIAFTNNDGSLATLRGIK